MFAPQIVSDMIKRLVILSAIALAVISCSNASQPLQMSDFCYEGGKPEAAVSIQAQLPVGASRVESVIRACLLENLYISVDPDVFGAGEASFPPYGGNPSDCAAAVEYIGSSALGSLADLSSADDAGGYAITYECDADLQLVRETEDYAVFNVSAYFYTGGAHGSMLGAGPLTFSKKNGEEFSAFLVDSALESLQGALLKGLRSYFEECGDTFGSDSEVLAQLFINDGIIPLPGYSLSPEEDGLRFLYQQYEVACYAAGMPTFVIPYSVLEPYLTPAARRLLAKDIQSSSKDNQ